MITVPIVLCVLTHELPIVIVDVPWQDSTSSNKGDLTFFLIIRNKNETESML